MVFCATSIKRRMSVWTRDGHFKEKMFFDYDSTTIILTCLTTEHTWVTAMLTWKFIFNTSVYSLFSYFLLENEHVHMVGLKIGVQSVNNKSCRGKYPLTGVAGAHKYALGEFWLVSSFILWDLEALKNRGCGPSKQALLKNCKVA